MNNYKILMKNTVFVRMWLVQIYAVLGDAFTG